MTAEALIPELADAGLLLQAALPLTELDAGTTDALIEAGIDTTPHTSLVMLAQAGRQFWELDVSAHLDLPNPFDDRSFAAVSAWFANTHPNASWEVVYPGDVAVPLGRLAQQAGWGAGSPLGLTIHPVFGLWIAHRIVFLTELAFPRLAQSATAHACDTCATTDCVSACPVGAVSIATGYDVEACAHHRVTENSGCALQCLARNACPVGSDYRYGDEQMTHHYGAGLRSIRAWLG